MLRLILIVFVAFLGACQQNPEKPSLDAPEAVNDAPNIEVIGKIVWADDDSAVAFHVKEAEGYQLYIEELADGGVRQALGKPSPNLPIAWYFMKQEGYVLRKSQNESGRLYFDRIDLSGHEITVLELQPPALDCPNSVLQANMLPSIDGRYVVFSYYNDCDNLQLDFLRAKSLASMANYTLSTQASSLHWQDQDLIISNSSTQQAWRAQRKVAPENIDYKACVLPDTSSATQSAQNEIIFFDDSGQLNFSSASPWCSTAE